MPLVIAASHFIVLIRLHLAVSVLIATCYELQVCLKNILELLTVSVYFLQVEMVVLMTLMSAYLTWSLQYSQLHFYHNC